MAKKNDNEDSPNGLEGRDEKGRFAAGNKWAYLRGKFDSEEALQAAIGEYFEQSKQKNGVYKPTLTGMVFHCGFASLQSFYDLAKDDRFSYTVTRARVFIQSCYELNLYGFAWGGAAFALKNIGRGDWSDEVIQHQKVENVTANFGAALPTPPESTKDT